jgi:hypothetical protein
MRNMRFHSGAAADTRTLPRTSDGQNGAGQSEHYGPDNVLQDTCLSNRRATTPQAVAPQSSNLPRRRHTCLRGDIYFVKDAWLPRFKRTTRVVPGRAPI